jgi:hypothetical protein
MKLVIEDLKTDRQWRSATGFDKKKFEKLVIVYEQAYRELYGCPMAERETINPLGATLGNEEELLFFTLFSLKSGLTYDLLGLVTGMDASNAQRNQEIGLEVLKKTLEDGGYAPKREFSSEGEFHRYFVKRGTLILDATEQRTQRPANMEQQKEQYSGKKKPTP